MARQPLAEVVAEVNWLIRQASALRLRSHAFAKSLGNLERPIKLLFAELSALLFVLVVQYLLSLKSLASIRASIVTNDIFGPLFFPKADPAHPIEWKDRVQAVALLLGLPAVFLLWQWRDRNVRDQIENGRKDINLKEFQEVCLRAAGALDEKLPQEAREQLQIAALHQLRGFLRGDYGASFKRPAFELLLSGHAQAIHRINIPAIQSDLNLNPNGRNRNEVATTILRFREKLTPIDRERMIIIRDEAEHIFTHNFPLTYRRFDLLNLSEKIFPQNLVFQGSHFLGTSFFRTDLNRTYFILSHLEGANLQFSNLKNADLRMSSLICADIRSASLINANLDTARLEGADLFRTQFDGAKLEEAVIDKHTNLNRTEFNGATEFTNYARSEDWPSLPEAEKQAARAPWLAGGAISVDAPPPIAAAEPDPPPNSPL